MRQGAERESCQPHSQFAYYQYMSIRYLIKPHKDEHVAHIYEHLYIVTLRRALFERGLLAYLDFAVDGTTRPSLIQIEISIYTTHAQEVFSDLMPFHAQIDDYVIREAAYEIGIEHGVEIEGDITQIKNAIVSLDDVTWADLNNMDSVNLGTEEQQHSIVQYTNKKMPLQQLLCRAVLNEAEDYEQIVPLFYVTATAILTNLLLVLNGRYHYYLRQVGAHFNDGNMYVEDVYDGWKSYSPELTDETKECKEVLDKLISENVASRIEQYLLSVDDDQQPGPNYDEIAQATGVSVDIKDWHELADRKKIDSILQNMIIELRYGGRKD